MVVGTVLSGPVEPWSDGETAFGRTSDVRPETYEAKDEWIAVLDIGGVEGIDDEDTEATHTNGVPEAEMPSDESGEEDNSVEAK